MERSGAESPSLHREKRPGQGHADVQLGVEPWIVSREHISLGLMFILLLG